MPVLKNARWERFAQELAKGKTADEAYQAAGYRPNRGNAATLKAKQNIQDRTQEILERAASRVEMTREWLLRRLQKNIEMCQTPGETFSPAAANKAIEMAGRELHRMFVERRIIGVRNIDQMTEAELLEFIGGEPSPEELGAATSPHPPGHA